MDPKRGRYRATLEAVLVVLNRHDLAGLAPGEPAGAPADEYGNEATPMVSILLNPGRIEREDVVRIWAKWFNDDLSGLSAEAWDALLSDLNCSARDR